MWDQLPGNEVSKNVILAGVDHMTILDATVLSKDDAEIQFLPSSNSFGKNKADAVYKRLHEMNPMVDLVVDKDDVSNKPETFYEKFDIVCLLGYPRELQIKVNEICHRNNIKFLSASNFGYYGYMFSDLGKHCYVEEKVKIDTVAKRKSKLGEPPAKQQKLDSSESQNTHDMIEQVINFKTLRNALSTKAVHGMSPRQIKSISKAYFVMQVMLEFSERSNRFPMVEHKSQDCIDLLQIRDSLLEEMEVDTDMLQDEFVSHCFGEISAVSCIVGGILGQEIIKAVSGNDAPHNNFFFYDGLESSGLVDHLGVD